MPTLLPTDDNNNPIPALRLKDGGAHTITASSSSTRNTSAFGSDTLILSLYASVPVYIRFGNASVTATSSDHYFPSGIYYDVAIGGDGSVQQTHIAVLRAGTSDGTIYLSEKY
ncbi:MAG: hypothetical protein WC043_09895 [Pseudobdellovibrionaceae bacterium]